jgi:hypothetical protein
VPEKKLRYVCTFKKHTLTSKLSLNPLHSSQSCRDAMTYSVTYKPEGSLFFRQYTIMNCASDEEAAWIGKKYCDDYGYKLIDIKKQDET